MASDPTLLRGAEAARRSDRFSPPEPPVLSENSVRALFLRLRSCRVVIHRLTSATRKPTPGWAGVSIVAFCVLLHAPTRFVLKNQDLTREFRRNCLKLSCLAVD